MGTTDDGGAAHREVGPDPAGGRPTRRSVVITGGVAAAAAWVAPTVLSVNAASAATFPVQPGLFLSTGNNVPAESLFEVDPLTAATTLISAMASDGQGEALATLNGSLWRFTDSGLSEITVTPFSETSFVAFSTPLSEIRGAVADGSDFLVVTTNQLRRVTTAGIVTDLGAPGFNFPRGLAFVAGTLFTGDRVSGNLYSIDPTDGSVLSTTAMVEVGLTPVDVTWGMATHPTTGVLYLAYSAASNRVLGTVDTATGTVTRIGVVDLPSSTAALAWL